MNRFESVTKPLVLFMALLLAALTAGCGGGGGRDPILGAGNAVLAPTVTAIAPVPNTIAVPVNTKIIAAAFSKVMDPTTIISPATNFTLACGALNTAGVVGTPLTLVAGAVSYVDAGNTATLTLAGTAPADDLPANADCTATVTTGTKDTTGIPLASNFSWIFTTGIARDLTRPRVTLTAPATSIPGPTAVPIGTAVTATFSKPMNPATIVAPGAFTLTCALPCVSPPASPAGAGNYVTYDLVSRTATYTPPATLAPSTTYTATIKGITALAVTDTVVAVPGPGANALAGNTAPLVGPSDYVWTFTTGLTPDTTRPRVLSTFPATGAIVAPATIPSPTLGVPTNTAITATFTEDMLPLTGANFTLTCAAPCVSPLGSVSYVGRTMTFTPSAPPLAAGTTYTATINGTSATPATDLAIPANALAGNQAALPAASDYIWRFTTAAALPAANVSVASTNPATGALAVCPTASINATFTVPSGLRMDPLTVNTGTFAVIDAALAPVAAASVLLDGGTGRIGTFTPLNPLPLGIYTATITGGATGVKDLAIPANTMLADYNVPAWTFTVVACPAPPASQLGTASTFGIMATAATTSTGATMINGDVSLEPGTSQGIPPVQVNGTIHVNDAVSTQARADLLTAYNYYKGLAPGAGANALGAGANPGALFPLGVPPGTYTSGSTIIASTPMILDAGGDANAVWVFQIGSSLTTGADVTLINGAQAKNVFWVPTLDATIGIGTIFQGTIIAGRDVTAVTGATINGRILAGATLAGTIALQATTVNVPAP